ncbi:hypothetical protein Tco_0726125 [Tanacetum coccineum]|uniref:Uncharacterized protein n=1 Tax=Tanacetum coccineum TaxID=301880 RepID=A0ABQ4YER4_9ASTR
MMDVVSGPELLHVDFWYISSDLKCFEEGSEFESIQYHLKSRIMDTTQAQQKVLDDALVAPDNCLNIRNCNLRLSSTLKSKEPTLQVVLDALKLTPFFKSFKITANVPEIYMQEFWATNYIHHSSL